MLEEYTEIPVKKIRGNGFITLSKFDDECAFMYICDQESDVIKKIDMSNYSVNNSYVGHSGIIWDIALSNNNMMVSVSGDMNYIIWETSSGDIILKKEMEGIPKIVKFNKTCDKFAIFVDSFSKNKSKKILIFDCVSKEMLSSEEFNISEIITDQTVTAMEWNDNNLVIGYQNGLLNIIDTTDNNKIVNETQLHTGAIKMFDKSSKFENIWLSASSDCTAKEFNINTFEIINVYNHEYPINVARYNYNNRKIYLGGGLDAMEVAKNNNNDLTLKVFKRQGKITNVINGHFGPIRDLNFSKVNNNFVTASQDGTIIVHLLDNIKKEEEKVENTEKIENVENTENVTATMSSKEKLMKDIFGGSNDKLNEIAKSEIKSDVVKMKNLNFKASKNVEQTRYIPGMAKPEHIIKQEKFENDLREKGPKSKNDENKMQERRQMYGIKIFGMPHETTEQSVRDIFENYGRIAGGRGIKLIATDKEYSKINGKKQRYLELMIIINYLSKESAERAVSSMDKQAFGHTLIDVQHCI
jgi:translation initiation factor 3 subunit I